MILRDPAEVLHACLVRVHCLASLRHHGKAYLDRWGPVAAEQTLRILLCEGSRWGRA